MNPRLLAAFVAALLIPAGKATWDFEKDTPGQPARGVTSEVGTWEVAEEGTNHVLAQKAKNDDDTFNVALVAKTSYKNFNMSVKIRAVDGSFDRGGGLIWRAKDKKNYYVCRYNPLESNFRVYKVVDGKRTMFADAKTPGDDKWHTIRVTMAGPKMTCYLDGKKHLEAEDGTFPDAGMMGFWSKSDAQSYFDELTVED